MAKKLKIWNGRGWGRANYHPETHEKLPTPIEHWCDHIYVCAHSKKEVLEMFKEMKKYLTVSEINNYWLPDCWGRQMEGIVPEVGIWGSQGAGSKPIRIYPQESDMEGKECTGCSKGIYTETSINDDKDGILHCNHCGERMTRHPLN
jgi:hypothetical protein